MADWDRDEVVFIKTIFLSFLNKIDRKLVDMVVKKRKFRFCLSKIKYFQVQIHEKVLIHTLKIVYNIPSYTNT